MIRIKITAQAVNIGTRGIFIITNIMIRTCLKNVETPVNRIFFEHLTFFKQALISEIGFVIIE